MGVTAGGSGLLAARQGSSRALPLWLPCGLWAADRTAVYPRQESYSTPSRGPQPQRTQRSIKKKQKTYRFEKFARKKTKVSSP